MNVDLVVEEAMWKEDAFSGSFTFLLVIFAPACGFVCFPVIESMILGMLTKSDDVDRQSVALEKAILKGQLQSSSLHTRYNDLSQWRHVDQVNRTYCTRTCESLHEFQRNIRTIIQY